MSQDPAFDQEEAVDEHLQANYADIIDLTNYEDEEDVQDLVENHLSDKIQKQGKVRRAKSKKAQRAQGGARKVSQGPPTYPPGPSRRLPSGDEHITSHHADDGPPERHRYSQVDGVSSRGASPSRDSLYATPRAPGLTSNDNRRMSSRSLAESAYARYDPYAATANSSGLNATGYGNGYGPSPSPSIYFGERDDHSMLNGAGGAGGDAYAESVRNLISRNSRTNSLIFVDDPAQGYDHNQRQSRGYSYAEGEGGLGSDTQREAGGLWIDEADYAAMNVMSEMARPGKPKLSQILEEEIDQAKGSLIVATCGPVRLNTVVRNLVSSHISPAKIRAGDRREHIAIYSEDYES